MNREEKIQQIKKIQSGELKPLDLINHGIWLWNLRDGVYKCGVMNFENVKLDHDGWIKFCEGGGTHIVTKYVASLPGADGGPVYKSEPTQEVINSSPLPHKETEVVNVKEEEPITEELKTEYTIKIRGDRVEDIAWQDVPFNGWINKLGKRY